MDQIEKILTDAGVTPTAIRIVVLRETLFRTLTLFLKHKILHDVDNGSGSRIYCRCECASTYMSHVHFTCTSCGQTFCIKDIDISVIPHPKGFIVNEMNFVMKGLCPQCSKRLV